LDFDSMSSIAEMHVVSRIADDRDELELSVVMPCLDEAATVGICVKKAIDALERHGIRGEVIVADNGSTDGSQQIASDFGARVVPVEKRGYGSALQAGIAAARGQFVLMGDADDTYDFSQLDEFVAKLREGYDLVMGNRFRGKILPGAMPALHRYLGNPVLTGLGRLFFKSPVGDFHCGLRAFRKDENGICERNDREGHGLRFARHGNPNDACSRPQGPRAAPPHVARWMAASAFFIVVQPALAVSLPGDCPGRFWNGGKRGASAGAAKDRERCV
jgi:glycosyltransferase involved in cell wall biosynthesis